MLNVFVKKDQRGFTLVELLVSIVLGLLVLLGLYQLLDQNQKVFRAQQQMTIMNNQVRSSMEAIVRAIRSAGSNSVALQGAPMVYTAQDSLIRVLADLPKDKHTDDGLGNITCNVANNYSFDITDCEGGGGIGDDENENGDERLNDAYEDVTFFLSGNHIILRQFSSNPGLETGGGGIDAISIDPDPPSMTDQVIAENILDLTFEYMADSNTFLTMSGSPLALPVSDLSSIQIVRIKIVAQTNDRDRSTGRFHTIELTSDVDLRNRGN
jgi:prepilin-type N-terminal cleavage/methylation domain-containing protein